MKLSKIASMFLSFLIYFSEKKSNNWKNLNISNHYLKLGFDKKYKNQYKNKILNPIMFNILRKYETYSGMLGIKTIVKVDNIIIFHLSRPGLLVGKAGKDIDSLIKDLSDLFNEIIEITIVEDEFSTQPKDYEFEYDY